MTQPKSVDEYLQGQDPAAVELFRRFQGLVERCGPSEVAARSSIVYWKRNRIFAGAFIKSRRLELNIDLLREADHPTMLAHVPHTKRVITHRLRITEPGQLDDSLAALVAEAYRFVGPGTRHSA
jgi:hypothetical protein